MIGSTELRQDDRLTALVKRMETEFSDHGTLLVTAMAIAAFSGLVLAGAVAKLFAAVGSSALLAFLRDVGQTVGGAGVVGAAGAAGAGYWGIRDTMPGPPSPYSGFAYTVNMDTGVPIMRGEPSNDSPAVAYPPQGARLPYSETADVNGGTWYKVTIPGGFSGWAGPNDSALTRPYIPQPTGPIKYQHYDIEVGPSARTAGARG